jgi:hypothetical protein
MFFRTSQKRFPNLCIYVQHATSRQAPSNQEIGAVSLMTLAGLAVPGALVLGIVFSQPIVAVLIGTAGLGSAFASVRTFKKAKTGIDRLDLEAAEANELLADALNHGKLQRIAYDSTTGLLETCARNWWRVRQALESPFWTGTSLPPHYKSVREQTGRAADRAMAEVVVMLRNELEVPYRSGLANRVTLSEVIEGVFGVQIPDMNSANAPLPVSFQSVKQLANKLDDLANNVEALTLEVAKDPAVQSEFKADTALDMALSEMRSIRQAEDELRQNLRG